MNRKRFLLYLAAFVFIIVFGYIIAILPTIQLHQKIKETENRIQSVYLKKQELVSLREELEQLDKISKNNFETDNKQDLLWKRFSNISLENNVRLLGFSEPTTFDVEDGYTAFINKISVQGKFRDLLNFINEIEQVSDLGRVISFDLYTVNDFKINKKYLNATLYVQNVEFKK